jgi:hypothetical protein
VALNLTWVLMQSLHSYISSSNYMVTLLREFLNRTLTSKGQSGTTNFNKLQW